MRKKFYTTSLSSVSRLLQYQKLTWLLKHALFPMECCLSQKAIWTSNIDIGSPMYILEVRYTYWKSDKHIGLPI